MAEKEKRYTLVEGTPDEHADAIEKAYKRAGQGSVNREVLLLVLVMLGVVGYAIYAFVYPLLQRGP
jgi:alkanesulfonate monooxygenase SsuD/methylene tetrahydromethanopterin reductase-like flavin-dependent oxidoreductase (luciferase family)